MCNRRYKITISYFLRVCPGKYIADATIWWVMANVLALFDISPYKDPITGQEETPVFAIDGNTVV